MRGKGKEGETRGKKENQSLVERLPQGGETGESPCQKKVTSQLLPSSPGAKESKSPPGTVLQALPWQHPGKQQTSRCSPFPRLWQKCGCPRKNPEGRDGCRLLALPRQPLGWHTCIASRATLMAVRAPYSADGSRILARDLPWHLHPATARQPCWRSQVFRRPVPCQFPPASLTQASPVPLYPALIRTISPPGTFLRTCLRCRFYFFLVHRNLNRGSQ